MTNPNDSAFAHWSPSGQQAGLTLQIVSAPEFATASVDHADLLIAALNEEGQADD